jgi:gliding motility-associated-like protein
VANPQTSTDYTVYITDIHNCVDTEYVSVQVYPQAVIELPDSVNIYPGEKYHLQPGTNATYFKWFPPSGINDINISDPLLYPEVRTRYFVTVTTEHGCMILDSLDILVKETVIDMPNAFAPSGTNKLFKPSKRGIANLKEFSIYNRWGNKVYSSANIEEGWDGTFNGQPQPMGVYVYTIEAISDKGTPFVKKGNVTLMR